MNTILTILLLTYGALLTLLLLVYLARRIRSLSMRGSAESRNHPRFEHFNEQDIIEAYTLNKGWSQLDSKQEFWLEDDQEQLLQKCCEIELEIFRQKGLLPNPAHFALLIQQLRRRGAAEQARTFLKSYKDAVDAYDALLLSSGKKFDRPYLPIRQNSEGTTLLAAYAEEFELHIDEVLPWKKAVNAKQNDSQSSRPT